MEDSEKIKILEFEIATLKGINEGMAEELERLERVKISTASIDALTLMWSLVYPDNPDGWGYPGEVYRHVKARLEEYYRAVEIALGVFSEVTALESISEEIEIQLQKLISMAKTKINEALRQNVAPIPDRPVEWCWREKGIENAHGPFPTKEAAILNAMEVIGKGKEVMVGDAVYPNPADMMDGIELDEILEMMDETAFSNGFYSEDREVFSVAMDNFQKAKKELHQVIGQWATKHVIVGPFTSQNEEVVKL